MSMPIFQAQNAVHAGRQLQVVGGDERGNAGGADEMHQRVEHMRGRVRVEVAGRLVGQDEARVVGERAGNGGALLLAARQLRGPVVDARRRGPVRRAAARRAATPRFRPRPRIICGMTTFSSAENSGSS